MKRSYFTSLGNSSECNTGSTISTLLHDKINPKDCQVLSLGDSGFLQFFRVVSSDEMANPAIGLCEDALCPYACPHAEVLWLDGSGVENSVRRVLLSFKFSNKEEV